MSELKGKFITFEGIEGCGKSTQQGLLVAWLESRGIRVVRTKNPGGTSIGARIREILLHTDHHHMAPSCEAMLYLADRAQHHHEVVIPALKEGHWVVCDRYHDSTLAYQGAARGLGRAQLDAMFEMAASSLQPDLTLLLDMDPAKGVGRAKTRNSETAMAEAEGRFEEEALHFHTQVRAGFLSLNDQEPRRFVKIDADRSENEVAATIREVLSQRWSETHV